MFGPHEDGHILHSLIIEINYFIKEQFLLITRGMLKWIMDFQIELLGVDYLCIFTSTEEWAIYNDKEGIHHIAGGVNCIADWPSRSWSSIICSRIEFQNYNITNIYYRWFFSSPSSLIRWNSGGSSFFCSSSSRTCRLSSSEWWMMHLKWSIIVYIDDIVIFEHDPRAVWISL